ncbi:unnamed protein product [Chilo suppressalis]|uniref:Odorant receptor n=1 Tax=Chilo suppressalis TaxID=168631 RepID=A0ABN8B6M0_CHISP|nr:unnamed protein product [Chilo suppressalis]
MRFRIFQRKLSLEENKSTLQSEPITNYLHFLEIPLKIVGCWDWYMKPETEYQIILNNIYYGMVLFFLINVPATLCVHLSTEWKDVMTTLDEIADCLPYFVSIVIVIYFGVYRQEMYDLIQSMGEQFKYRSANGLTNMTMLNSYITAKKFALFYTICTLFSVSMYVVPELISWWTNKPLQSFMYMDITKSPFFEITFLTLYLSQAFVGLAMGQFGVFFAANSILLCGQLDLLCCSLRNTRYTALLQSGVHYRSLRLSHSDIKSDELHNYIYNVAEMEESSYHYDDKMVSRYIFTQNCSDIYSSEYDEATERALRDCARMCRVVNSYRERFERFVSPLLAMRVVQVTMYLCMLLYSATLKFDMVTVEYLGAVALDIFVYCFYGNQIIIQADRVTTAAYQSAWATMGVRGRRLLLNVLLANRRAVAVRAGNMWQQHYAETGLLLL